jgi:hypothetical protein
MVIKQKEESKQNRKQAHGIERKIKNQGRSR